MNKQEQININNKVLEVIADFNSQSLGCTEPKRLRTCSACVFKRGHYWVLQSYSTIIALIDTESDTLYDFLRYVYGYTSTSAQHICKFGKDYGNGKWGCTHSMTYRAV